MMPVPLAIRIALWTWLLAALLFGRLELLDRLPTLSLPGIILLLTAALFGCYQKLAGFRAWIDALDLRALVLFPVTRFVGFYFLLLYRRGELPYALAVPGGGGDITVAALALAVTLLPLTEASRRRAISIWNVVGFLEMLLVVGTAARLSLADNRQLPALATLLLSLPPTFLVPLIIAIHLMIFLRLRRTPSPA